MRKETKKQRTQNKTIGHKRPLVKSLPLPPTPLVKSYKLNYVKQAEDIGRTLSLPETSLLTNGWFTAQPGAFSLSVVTDWKLGLFF